MRNNLYARSPRSVNIFSGPFGSAVGERMRNSLYVRQVLVRSIYLMTRFPVWLSSG